MILKLDMVQNFWAKRLKIQNFQAISFVYFSIQLNIFLFSNFRDIHLCETSISDTEKYNSGIYNGIFEDSFSQHYSLIKT